MPGGWLPVIRFLAFQYSQMESLPYCNFSIQKRLDGHWGDRTHTLLRTIYVFSGKCLPMTRYKLKWTESNRTDHNWTMIQPNVNKIHMIQCVRHNSCLITLKWVESNNECGFRLEWIIQSKCSFRKAKINLWPREATALFCSIFSGFTHFKCSFWRTFFSLWLNFLILFLLSAIK